MAPLTEIVSIRTELEGKLQGVAGLGRRPSRYGHSYAYFVADREIAHFHGDGRMDVRLTRERIREMKSDRLLDARIETRGPSAEWVTVRVAEERDLSLALQLVEEAVRANS